MKPFVPGVTRFQVWKAKDVDVQVDDYLKEYGYKERSRQDRFFDNPGSAREVAIVFTGNGTPPHHLADARVVARIFGERNRGVFTIWYVGINKAHPFNNSERGARWGICNNVRYNGRRWLRGETLLTQAKAEQVVGGTPNPYLASCLSRYGAEYNVEGMHQDASMPCAKLFSSEYSRPGDQRSHPAVLLLYLSMGFVRPPQLSHYVRSEGAPPLAALYQRLLRCMKVGIPAVAPR